MSSKLPREESLQWVLDKLAAAKKNTPTPKFKVEAIKPLKSLAPAPLNLKNVREREVAMWHTWKKSDFDPVHLDPLLDSYKSLINTSVNKFKNKVEVPTAALDFRAKAIVVDALKKWDPDKGASLSTYLTTNLKRLGRFVQEVQNFARLPDNLVRHVGTYNAVKSDLTDRLGHEPDDVMLYEECNKLDPRMTMGHIKRLNKELRKGLLHTGFETKDVFSQGDMTPRHKEVIGLIQHQLTPEEKVVHEYWFGLNGKPSLATSSIAKKQKWDDSKVSKLKKSIFDKMKPYLD